MYRKMLPKGGDQWINSLIDADWTDPSNPVVKGPDVEDSSMMAHTLTPFYISLYSKKPIIRDDLNT